MTKFCWLKLPYLIGNMQRPLTDLRSCAIPPPRPAWCTCQTRCDLHSTPVWRRQQYRRRRHTHSRWVLQHPAAASGGALGAADLPPEQPESFIESVDVFPRLRERDVYK